MKKIAISFRIVDSPNYPEIRDALSHDWADFLQKLNLIPIWIPNNIVNLDEFFKEIDIDGIILSGGDDLGVTPIRDKTETSIIKYAINKKIPLLGICRGMQLLNNYFGGFSTKLNSLDHIGNEHSLMIEGNFLKKLPQSITVNSYHNNVITINNLSNDLSIFATTKNDNTIEGLFHKQFPIVGLMWHPEREQKEFDYHILKFLFDNNE